MSSRTIPLAVAACTVAAVLSPRLLAQEKPVDALPTRPAASAAPFDVAPTLAAMTQAASGQVDPERPIGDAAWVVLALLANGSTLKAGTHRVEVRLQTKWLLDHQDAEGWFASRSLPSNDLPGKDPRVPCSPSEQLLGALAITEACEISGHRPYKPFSKCSIERAAKVMLRSEAPPATVDEFVLSLLLARCLRSSQREHEEIGQVDLVRILARSRFTAGKVRRIDAALHLDELLQGKKHAPELTVATAWPSNLTADPLHTLVGALAVSVSSMAETARAAQFETLAALVAARETKGEHAGTWAPAGGFDRTATTAMHAITLALANGNTPLFCAK